LAQSTAQMDWSNLELVVYAAESKSAEGLVCLPSDDILRKITLNKQGGSFRLAENPLAGKAVFKIRTAEVKK
jgi:alpha-D-xyloside xylohydrolase